MFLNIVGTCNDYGIISLVHVLKTILKVVQIVGPILALIAFTVTLTKMMANPEEKKLKKKLLNSLLALFILFAVPTFVNVSMVMIDDSFTFATCWNYADKEIKLDSRYISTQKGEPSKITGNRNDYEKGDERKTPSNDGNGSNSNNNNSGGGATVGPTNANISKRIFVGDSRTVQMYAYLTSDWNGANYSSGGVHVVGSDVFICQGSMGLAWMKSTGIPEANKYMGNGSALIILMGVNDLYNLNEYVRYMNNNYTSWTSKGATVYFDSVNPCTGKYANLLNNKIVAFNNGIKQGLNSNIRYIDSHSYLIRTGYSATDGLHYDKTSSDKIYNYIKSNL